MTFQKDKTTVAQTAANASATVTAALVTAGVIDSRSATTDFFEKLQESVFATLEKVVEGDNAMFKAEDGGGSRSSSGGNKSKSSGGRKSSGGGKKSGFPGSLRDALKLELNSGAFEGTTLGDVLGLSEEDADADYAYGDGEKSGRDYIAWLATERNKNEYTRGAAQLIAEDNDIEPLD